MVTVNDIVGKLLKAIKYKGKFARKYCNKQCFHLQGFFLAARKYWSLQGIYKEMARKNTKIKVNCKDFCNLYIPVTSLQPVKINL